MPTRFGTNGKDVIDFRAQAQAWTIDALEGNDIVYGSRFDDRLWGREGDDRLHGEDGADLLTGGQGRDTLVGGAGNDTLRGDDGAFNPNPVGERDILYGGDGNDQLDGEGGDDTLFGDTGDDVLIGGYGNDTLLGGAGADRMHGGWGKDDLNGGAGNDRLEGHKGADRLTGGAGADRFEFSAEDFVTATILIANVPVTVDRFETDTITDFAGASGDRIDVSAMLLSASTFAGATPADAVAQGYIYWAQHGQPNQPGFGTTVYIDLNGGAHTAIDALLGQYFALADLQGVAANQVSANHFLV